MKFGRSGHLAAATALAITLGACANNDPLTQGRVEVRVPAVLGETTLWALPCTPPGVTS